MLDDVADFAGVEAEVDRYEDATEAAHTEERDEKLGGVGADDGHLAAPLHAEILQRGRHPAGAPIQVGVGQTTERASRGRLIDDSRPIPVHDCGAL